MPNQDAEQHTPNDGGHIPDETEDAEQYEHSQLRERIESVQEERIIADAPDRVATLTAYSPIEIIDSGNIYFRVSPNTSNFERAVSAIKKEILKYGEDGIEIEIQNLWVPLETVSENEEHIISLESFEREPETLEIEGEEAKITVPHINATVTEGEDENHLKLIYRGSSNTVIPVKMDHPDRPFTVTHWVPATAMRETGATSVLEMSLHCENIFNRGREPDTQNRAEARQQLQDALERQESFDGEISDLQADTADSSETSDGTDDYVGWETSASQEHNHNSVLHTEEENLAEHTREALSEDFDGRYSHAETETEELRELAEDIKLRVDNLLQKRQRIIEKMEEIQEQREQETGEDETTGESSENIIQTDRETHSQLVQNDAQATTSGPETSLTHEQVRRAAEAFGEENLNLTLTR